MMETQSVDAYQTRAARQRRELHNSVEDLKDVLRQRLDVKANARQYIVPAAGIMAVIGLAAGYAAAGLFTSGRDRHESRHEYGRWMDLE